MKLAEDLACYSKGPSWIFLLMVKISHWSNIVSTYSCWREPTKPDKPRHWMR
jgi:hypothetical protein